MNCVHYDTLLLQERYDKARTEFEKIWYIIANVANINVHIQDDPREPDIFKTNRTQLFFK